MASLTDLRLAVMAKLNTDFEDLDIKFYAGKFDGPSQNQDLGFVFPVRAEPSHRDVNIRDEVLAVRVFLQKLPQQDPTFELSLDPTPLEDVEARIILSLQPMQGDNTIEQGYFQWLGSEYDLTLQGVEVQFRSYHRSEFAMGG
jgi:hypothetical protein